MYIFLLLSVPQQCSFPTLGSITFICSFQFLLAENFREVNVGNMNFINLHLIYAIAHSNACGVFYDNSSVCFFRTHMRMCVSGQVTEETSVILSALGYICSCRGIINVKGKGELKTYFVHTEMSRSLSQGTVMP